MSVLTSKKFATRTSSNHSHVLRGGIFAWPLPCEGLTLPMGGGASVRCAVFMVTSALRLAARLYARSNRTPDCAASTRPHAAASPVPDGTHCSQDRQYSLALAPH